MEAKDTVIKTTGNNCHDPIEQRLLDQAKKTWDTAFQEGTKEVIEFVTSHKLSAGNISIPAKVWQAKLKKWGVSAKPSPSK